MYDRCYIKINSFYVFEYITANKLPRVLMTVILSCQTNYLEIEFTNSGSAISGQIIMLNILHNAIINYGLN